MWILTIYAVIGLMIISPFLLVALIAWIRWLWKMEQAARRRILGNMAKIVVSVVAFVWLWQQPIFGGLTGEWRLVSDFSGGFGQRVYAPQTMRLNPDGTGTMTFVQGRFQGTIQETSWRMEVFSPGFPWESEDLRFEPSWFGGGLAYEVRFWGFGLFMTLEDTLRSEWGGVDIGRFDTSWDFRAQFRQRIFDVQGVSMSLRSLGNMGLAAIPYIIGFSLLTLAFLASCSLLLLGMKRKLPIFLKERRLEKRLKKAKMSANELEMEKMNLKSLYNQQMAVFLLSTVGLWAILDFLFFPEFGVWFNWVFFLWALAAFGYAVVYPGGKVLLAAWREE
ncbi:MAG: hypothetical protein FWG65_01245 [Turicibacter sp.]|nr:hypothetical protein [Turicibacter sp.]